ncbi:MAG: hypothetical protein NVS2B4_06170 [Ramlibacter sp.]
MPNPQPRPPLGPPPFRFQPQPAPSLRGASFSVPFKGLATVLVAGSIGWLVRLWLQGRLGTGLSVNLAWFLGAIVLMVWTWWAVVRSVTTLDAGALHQTWLWDKRMVLDDLATARLIRIRGFDWLIAPRLYVRTLVGKFAVFYVADSRLAAQCERLTQELKAFRNMR